MPSAPQKRLCRDCGAHKPVWRCRPCLCPATLCTGCMRTRKDLNSKPTCPICGTATGRSYARKKVAFGDCTCYEIPRREIPNADVITGSARIHLARALAKIYNQRKRRVETK